MGAATRKVLVESVSQAAVGRFFFGQALGHASNVSVIHRQASSLYRGASSNSHRMPQLKIRPVLQTWGRTLRGRVPSLSIEITKECPLRCPGCYAYEDAHLGTTNLRSLSDFKGQELIERFLAVVEEHCPLHVSIVGGDPLVRYRELDVLLPKLVKHCHVQVVTSAFRAIPASWATLPNLQLVVSIDGLEAEHNARRKPATYERILRNFRGQRVVVHCTITSAMLQRDDYLPEFVDFWSVNPAVQKIWRASSHHSAGRQVTNA
jgi:MoaA/NifB/PqqE/SkfB family radical SAM enzyme